MVLNSGKTNVVLGIDEKFVIGVDEEQYDQIFNPNNVQRNEPHDALSIIASGEKNRRIAVIVKHDKDAVYSGTLYDDELTVTFGKDAMTLNIKTGELIRYEKEALDENFDFQFFDEILKTE